MNMWFDTLWTAWLEGEFREADHTELDAALAKDPALTALAVDRYQQHRLLGRIHQESDGDSEGFVAATLRELPVGGRSFAESTIARLPGHRSRISPLWIVPALAAAAAVMLFVGLRGADPVSSEAVARLILAEDCEWQPESLDLVEGQNLRPGPIGLKRGSAVLRFAGGAELVLSGNSRIELLSGNHGRLEFGQAVIRAEDGADGFTLDTPASSFVDLGTEFAVKVEPSGVTRMQVHEGEVESNSGVIKAGRALRYESSQKVAVETDLEPVLPRFAEMVRGANPRSRPDLMQVYEGFHLDEGAYLPEKMDGGKGWAGPWRLRGPGEQSHHGQPEADSKVCIVHGRMNGTWPVKGGRLGALSLGPGYHKRVRELAEPIRFNEDGITFFSFMVDELRGAAGPADFRIELKSSNRDSRGTASFGWAESRKPQVRTGGGSFSRATRPLQDGAVLCVGKIVRAKSAPDRIYFRCYDRSENFHLMEPADWDIDGHSADLHGVHDLLVVETSGERTIFLDELRIGPTWRSVTPINSEKL